MRIIRPPKSISSLSLLLTASLLYSVTTQCKDTDDLKITSSSDSGSNKVNSFIVVPENSYIPMGIKQRSSQKNIALQAPFVIELKQTAADNENIIWKIVITKKNTAASTCYRRSREA